MTEKKYVDGSTSDGYHTFDELYHYRMLYNAAFVNTESMEGHAHKSLRHSDGKLCFNGGWFVVVMELPTGQITNHYRLTETNWDLFKIEERTVAAEYDGHTPEEAANRLQAFVRGY